ncbi:MAG: hypothetical protein ACOC4M_11445, partial [Promethearchaeia archaeon]
MPVPIFNDPGVYVVEEMTPTAAEPSIPSQPAAVIGPMFQIVDQDSVTNTETEVTEDDMLDIENNDIITLSYPSIEDSDNPVDVDSVKVELVKSDGRREEIPEEDVDENTCLNISESEVEVMLGDSSGGEAYTFYQELNDEWLGKDVDYSESEPDWGGIDGAEIHITYRAVREDRVGDVLEVQGSEAAQILLGKADLDNPLGLAGGIATTVAPNTGCYFVPTKDYLTEVDGGDSVDESTEISNALGRLEPIRAYGIVALTDSETSHQTVTNHVNTLSDPEEKMYRVAWTYKPIPTKEEVAEYSDINEDDLTDLEVKQYQAEMLAQYATSVSDERTICLYNDFTLEIDGEEKEVPGYYLDVLFAAFKADLAPQQGLTNYPVGGVIKDLKYQKGYFKPSQLKEISEGGIFACVQDMEDAPIRSRAQWTTNTLNNKTKQTSIRYAVDFFSWSVIDTLEPLIGIRNVTDSTLQ